MFWTLECFLYFDLFIKTKLHHHLRVLDHMETEYGKLYGDICGVFYTQRHVQGILPKRPYPPCLRMADRALLAGYPRCMGNTSLIVIASQELLYWEMSSGNQHWDDYLGTLSYNPVSATHLKTKHPYWDSKVHGANMGPTWVLSLAPWPLLSG